MRGTGGPELPPDAAFGTLFVVATPIGNVGDLSPRAREVLGSVDVIACEDTRHTGRLLSRIGIPGRTLRAFHDHNERDAAQGFVSMLEEGKDVALVSDAGTPTISDPGYRLVKAALCAEVAVVSVPGPSSVIAGLSISGLPTDRFSFEGFLPAASGRRRKVMEHLAAEQATGRGRTLVFLESARRLVPTLRLIEETFGPVECAVCREMTKLHEEVVRAPVGELAARFEATPAKGEVVLVIDARSATLPVLAVEAEPPVEREDFTRRATELAAEGIPRAEAIRILVSEGHRRSQARAEMDRVLARRPGPGSSDRP